MAFLPTGLVKATGQRFTTLPVETPVGFFFEAMYQTGPYWRFIGLTQIAAAVLLLIPRTVTLGALLFLPISISIFLITWGVGFGGTVYIAAGMIASVTYLLSWDGDRIWSAASQLLGGRPRRSLLEGVHWLERAGWALGAAVGMGLVMSTRSFVPASLRDDMFFVGLGAAGLVVAGWIAAVRGAGSRSGAG